MMYKPFASDQESHQHSLQTLETLYEYDDFMESVGSLADMGCGNGLDLEWWATRTTRDENPIPLHIKCTGIDLKNKLSLINRYKNVQYLNQDFEESIDTSSEKFDLIWCHDSFQYVLDPLKTLKNWHDAINVNGMLIIVVPQTTNLEFNQQAFDQWDFVYHHWTMVNLIHALAITGWDCADGFYLKRPDDPWLHAVVYKGQRAPLDPRTTRWYDLAEQGCLPKSAVESINKYGYLRQRDLVLPWLDRSLTWMGQN